MVRRDARSPCAAGLVSIGAPSDFSDGSVGCRGMREPRRNVPGFASLPANAACYLVGKTPARREAEPRMDRNCAPPWTPMPAARAAAILVLLLAASGAAALEAQPGEQKAIDACDKRLCTMLQTKDPSGEDLKCALTKTFTRSTLKEGDTAQVKWGFGDARCSVQINITRAAIVTAVTAKSYKFWVPLTTANCVVELDGQLKTVTAKLEPKIEFKDGRAEKVWINLREVEGPAAIKATLTLGAQLNDSVGLFHRSMLKSINGYIYKLC